MTMSLSLRKFVLTLHVITTMGWLGSVAAYIPIAAYILTNEDAEKVRSAIQIMSLVVNYIVLPVAFASLLTGIAISLGTKWGLLRHYWIVFKLVLTAFAVFMLVAYTQKLNYATTIAEHRTLSSSDIDILKAPIHIIHPIGGLLVVLIATVLSMYKPKGMTRYGWRKQQEIKRSTEPYTTPRWSKRIGFAAISMLLFLIVIMAIF